jgi:tRNA nucleotidyltransferase (CCA-adding enzyme)
MTTRPSAPPAASWITRTLEDAGHETWAVGGAVRDACLGRPSDDWDFATHARPKQVRRLFRRTVPVGVEHGTVGVLARDGTLYEVTTFRRDVATDGRHAVVAFAETLDEDLARRDFTINAVAWHPLREELHDPFDGMGDLRRGVLRTVGEPNERFSEDFLRILRALRFAGRFALRIEEVTWEALCSHVESLRGLSGERIREELVKVLDDDPDPSTSLRLYAESGALRVLYPELDALRSESASSPWALAVESAAALPVGRPWLRLAALLVDVPNDQAAAVLLRLRLSNQGTDRIARVAGAAALPAPDAPDASYRRWLSAHGVSLFPPIARVLLARAKAGRALARHGLTPREAARQEPALHGPLDSPLPDDDVERMVASWRRARAVRAAGPPLTVGDLALDGRGLIALGLEPGPDFGRILEGLLDWVLEDPARNDPEVLRARVLARSEELRRG